MGAHPEALGAEGRDGLVEDLAAAAHDGDLRAVARELGGDLEADAGTPAGDQRRLHPSLRRTSSHGKYPLSKKWVAAPRPPRGGKDNPRQNLYETPT